MANLSQSILSFKKTKLNFEREENHQLLSKKWNSYNEFMYDFEQYQKTENVILSIVDSRLIKNNRDLKDKFYYELCVVKCT